MAFALIGVGCGTTVKQPSSLDTDRRTLCASALSSGLTLATAFPLREPITLRTDDRCRDVLPDVEYALLSVVLPHEW